MNRILRHVSLYYFVAALVLAMAAPVGAQLTTAPKNAGGEQFCMVSSLDMKKQQVVLMQPTQLTIIATVTPQTQFLGENGQKLALKDMRAGDTVWALVKTEKGGQIVAVRIREGRMTVDELHKLYLNSSGSPVPSAVPNAGASETRSMSSAPTAQVSAAHSPAGTVARPRRHHRPGTGVS
jgi:hypothetical protein